MLLEEISHCDCDFDYDTDNESDKNFKCRYDPDVMNLGLRCEYEFNTSFGICSPLLSR